MPDIKLGRLRGGFCVYWNGPDGKRTRHQLSARTRKEAEAEAIDLYRRKAHRDTGSTIDDLWDAYVKDREDRPIAETMKYTGKAVLSHFGALRPDQIRIDDCRNYATARRKDKISDGSIWTELGHLRSVVNWAYKHGMIDRAPVIERPSKPAPKERYLTRDEISRLLAVKCEPHIRLSMILMLSTAARVGALLELTWDRVDMERGQINLRAGDTQTRKGRAVVPINAGLRAALQEARKAALSDYVIEWAGGPVKSIRKGIVNAAKRAEVPEVSPHVFRHTAAVHMAEAGVPMSEISQYLGHSNVQVTERVYARYSPDHLRKAADVVDFTAVRGVR